jgi:tRNA threonylcarbamoyladenosine biosynthesis protein TsaB
MNILSIETSTQKISLALLKKDEELIIEYDSNEVHSNIILNEIKTLLSKSNISIQKIDGIVYSAGPGSFTGIRVAMGVALGLAYPEKIPVVGINCLESLALQANSKYILSTIDARMGEIYMALYENKNNTKKLEAVIEPLVCNPQNLPKIDDEIMDNLTILGTGFLEYKELFKGSYSKAKEFILNSPEKLSIFQAEVGKLKLPDKFDLNIVQPIYIRNKVAMTIKERYENKHS